MRRISWYPILSILVLALIIVFFVNYVLNAAPTFHLRNESNIELGVSIIQQDISTLLNQFESNSFPIDERTISFLLQSTSPTAQVYLDYIAIYSENANSSLICFESISMPKSEDIPFEIVSAVVQDNLTISSTEFRYNFPQDANESCLNTGAQKIMPHILLGVVPVHSDFKILGVPLVDQEFDSFPFDQQIINLNMMVDAKELGNFSPSIKAVVAQNGWAGSFNRDKTGEPILHLRRHPFFQFILILFIIIMILIIPLLNSVIDEPASFFEVAFSILLGLWGLHTILIPEHIQSSLVVDGIFYVLYIMVLIAIFRELLRISVLNLTKRSVRIVHVEYDPPGNDLEGEYVEIANHSILEVNMADWHLFDKARNRYTFPHFALQRKSSVKVWTKRGQDDQTNLYWKRDKPIWNNNGDIATLEDDQYVIIDNYEYTRK